MNQIGSLLLALGFLCGAFVSVYQPDRVSWPLYFSCLVAMGCGMVLHRVARHRRERSEEGQQAASVGALQRSLTSLAQKVAVLEQDATDEQQLAVFRRIDDELMEDINDFVEARESMIPRFGMQTYANVMTPFANAERLLNRAWSASADGYVDEVRTCVGRARKELERAGTLLAQADGGA